MKCLFFLLTLALVLPWQATPAQSYPQLNKLPAQEVQVYYSSGQEPRAAAIARQVTGALQYLQEQLRFRPEVTLLVLSHQDWSRYTTFPVYGMPHYSSNKTLIVAAEDNPFWQSFLPPLELLPADLRQQVQTVYQKSGSGVSLQPFFDLLALHELGHAFHLQGGLSVQRKWMGELFCNILLHTYVAEKEPHLLPALTLFPQMVIGNGAAEFSFTSLADIEAQYEEIGQQHPKNYGWYQSRWHAAAATIYHADGAAVCRRLWHALQVQKEPLDDAALRRLLMDANIGSIAQMWQRWDAETIK